MARAARAATTLPMHKALQLLLGLAAASAFLSPRRAVQRPSQHKEKQRRRGRVAHDASCMDPSSPKRAAKCNLYLIEIGAGKTRDDELVRPGSSAPTIPGYTRLVKDDETRADIFEKDGGSPSACAGRPSWSSYVRLVVARHKSNASQLNHDLHAINTTIKTASCVICATAYGAYLTG